MKHPLLMTASLSTLFLILGLPPFQLWVLSWLAFLPWFYLLETQAVSLRLLFLSTLATGLIYFGYGLYWLWGYDNTVYLCALFSLAPTFSLFLILYAYLKEKVSHISLKILLVPAIWIVMMKSYSYLPIGTIAQEVPFYGPFEFFQIASIAGFKTHGAFVLGLSASIALGIHKRKWSSGILTAFFLAALLTSYFWGKIQLTEHSAEGNHKVALIQHNLPAPLEWNIKHNKEISETYEHLALEAVKSKPEILIFPLYNLSGDALRNPAFFTNLAAKVKTPILLGTYVPSETRDGIWDMAILYSPDGKVSDFYQSIAPPPFRRIGEKNIADYKTIKTSLGTAGIFLCYENGLERMALKAANLGSDFFISLSNPGFFNRSFMSEFHLMQDRMRALESGRYVLRVSPNGPSAVIDHRGRILERTNLSEEKILTAELSNHSEKSFYQSFPDLSFWTALIFLIGVLFKNPIPAIRLKNI